MNTKTSLEIPELIYLYNITMTLSMGCENDTFVFACLNMYCHWRSSLAPT